MIFAGEVLIDLTQDTVNPANLKKGITAHQANGDSIVGTLEDTMEDDVDRVLFNGFQNGNILIKDDGITYIQENKDTGQKLEKTFKDAVCHIVLKDKGGQVLGELTKTYEKESSVITYRNKHSGQKIVKEFWFDGAVLNKLIMTTYDFSDAVISTVTKQYLN